MATDSNYTSATTDYDDDTETLPSADSLNYLSNQSMVLKDNDINNNKDESDQKKDSASSQPRHHRKRSGLLCIFALIVLC